MAGNLGTAVIEFSADTAKFVGDVGRASATFNRSMAQMERGIESLRNAFVTLAAFGGMGAMIKSAIDAGDALNKLSQKVGISVESLSELKLGAQLADVDLDALTTGLKKFNVALAAAKDDTSKQAEIFRQLGVDITQGPEIALRQMADAVSKLADGETKTALATEMFGRAGINMIPWLNAGAAGMDKAAASARALGLTISADFAQKAEQFNDNMKLLGKQSEMLGVSIASQLVPGLSSFTGKLVEAAEKGELLSGVLRELIKLDLALFAKLPGPLGALADMAATSMFAEPRGGNVVSGRIRRPFEEAVGPPAPNPEALACVVSGGKWVNGRCVRAGGGSNADPFGDQARRLALIRSNLEFGDSEFVKMKTLLAEDKVLKGLEPTQKRRLLDLAAEVDVFKQLQAQEKEREDGLAQNSVESSRIGNEEIRRLTQLRAAMIELIDPLEKYRAQLADVDRLEQAGLLTQDQALEARFAINNAMEDTNQKLNGLEKNTEKVTDEMTEFWKAAAQNMQGAMSTFFFDVMQGNLSDLSASFKRTIDQMVANMLAAKAATALFGADFVKNQKIGGFIGQIASTVFGPMTQAPAPVQEGPSRAIGGPVMRGSTYLVGERGPELFTPAAAGNITPNHALGGITVNMTVNTPDAGGFRASRGQIAAELSMALAGARRNL